MTRASQLLEFKQKYGHARVPKRYKEDPGLANWVNKQRQQYRNFHTGQKPCSLTPERIELLNQLGFCWNTTESQAAAYVKDDRDGNTEDHGDWWVHYHELQKNVSAWRASNPNTSLVAFVPRQGILGKWLQKQRTATLTTEQVEALHQLDPDWRMTYRELLWEQRYRELQVYRSQHGDCCVPISYSENQPLAHWVSNQRKLYNKNLLSRERLQRLNAIGFVWNRWEHEFAKKTFVWGDEK